MALLSNPGRVAALEDAAHDDTRYLNLAVKYRRRSTGEILLRAGGQWDKVERAYIGAAPRCKVIDVEEGQVEFVKWVANWIEQRRQGVVERDRLVLAGGPRRAGKTFISTFGVVACALAFPGTINWMVSPTFQKRDELERLIKNYLPRSWWRYRDAPIYRFTLANGSTIQLLSGDDPETLKRGGATVVFYNEAQEFDVGALSYGLPAIIDDGGIGILAANPPRRQKGEWILTLREAIIEKLIPGGKFIAFTAALNEQIDQTARKDVGEILAKIDPRAAIADDEGNWMPVGDRAYPHFHKLRNLGAAPQLGDVTEEWVRKKLGRPLPFAAGVDFQGNPWHCAVVVKVFKGEDASSPVYHVVDEQLTEGVEEDFLTEFEDREKYEPTSLFWVGDASGQFQDGDHTRGRQSFSIFKKFGWRIVPPVEKKTTKGQFSKNPNLDDRLNLVNKLLSKGRLIIDPLACPRLTESIKDCEMKMHMSRRRPVGRHAHITDALGYVLFYLEPRTRVERKPDARGVLPVELFRGGPRMY